MTSFDIKNDLMVKFRGHHLIGRKTFKLNRLNRLKVMTIDGKWGEERRRRRRRRKKECAVIELLFGAKKICKPGHSDGLGAKS